MEVPEGCGEAKMGRNKTMSKLKKQDEKQQKIKNNKKSELGVKGVRGRANKCGTPNKPSRADDVTHRNREGCAD